MLVVGRSSVVFEWPHVLKELKKMKVPFILIVFIRYPRTTRSLTRKIVV